MPRDDVWKTEHAVEWDRTTDSSYGLPRLSMWTLIGLNWTDMGQIPAATSVCSTMRVRPRVARVRLRQLIVRAGFRPNLA